MMSAIRIAPVRRQPTPRATPQKSAADDFTTAHAMSTLPAPDLARSETVADYELAQLNIAVMKEPLDSPVMADFVANLDRINAIAESSPGFVWRLKTDDGNATALRPLGEQTLVNMSVWRDVASLNDYVYKSAHTQIMRRRKEWFGRMAEASLVMWWVPAGHRPTIAEAIARLEALRKNGPTPEAFHFGAAFPPPDAQSSPEPFALGDHCPA